MFGDSDGNAISHVHFTRKFHITVSLFVFCFELDIYAVKILQFIICFYTEMSLSIEKISHIIRLSWTGIITKAWRLWQQYGIKGIKTQVKTDGACKRWCLHHIYVCLTCTPWQFYIVDILSQIIIIRLCGFQNKINLSLSFFSFFLSFFYVWLGWCFWWWLIHSTSEGRWY